MSWSQWPVGGTSTLPGVINPAPTVANPVQPVLNSAVPSAIPTQYTPEQWAQMQHQNWQQWAQWQQQYQQWHQQYGAEYQKVINAQGVGSIQPPLPVPQLPTNLLNTSLPPPPPVEAKPPLPPEEPPNNVPAPPSNHGVNYAQPPPQKNYERNYSSGRNLNWQTAGDNRNRRYSNQAQPQEYGYGKRNSSFSDGGDQKRSKLDDSWQKTNEAPSNHWNSTPQKPPPKATSVEELSEAEKKFDKQFAEWEAQFNKWKEQNANHPDKTQYREYEKKWETWRAQLLERREQMRRKRLNLANASPKLSLSEKKMPLLNTPSDIPESQMTSFNRPPPTVNNDPLEFAKKVIPGFDDKESNHSESQEKKEFDASFLTSANAGGIPGLDLVKEDDKGSKSETEVIDADNAKSPVSENVGKPQDLEALSKGINSILGDQKLLSMLSLVSQNQNLNFSNNSISTVSQALVERNDHSNQSMDDSSNPIGNYNFSKPNEGFNTFDDQTRSSFTAGVNDQEIRFEKPRLDDSSNRMNFKVPPDFQNFRQNDKNLRKPEQPAFRDSIDSRGDNQFRDTHAFQDEDGGGGNAFGNRFRGPNNMQGNAYSSNFNTNEERWENNYNRSSIDFNREETDCSRGGPDSFNRTGPHNFNMGTPNDFNRTDPNNFNRMGPNDFNRGSSNEFSRGGSSNFYRGESNDFNRGNNIDLNRGVPNNCNRSGSNELNRTGGPNDFNRGGSNNFSRGLPNDFNRAGPNSFNRGGPSSERFNEDGNRHNFNKPWIRDGNPEGFNTKDNFEQNTFNNLENFGDNVRDNFRGSSHYGRGGGDNFRGASSGPNGGFCDGFNYIENNRSKQNFLDNDIRGQSDLLTNCKEGPPRGSDNFGRRDNFSRGRPENFGASPNEPWNRGFDEYLMGSDDKFSREPILGNKRDRFSGPSDNYDEHTNQLHQKLPAQPPMTESMTESAVVYDILKPETVVEYDHKSLKSAEPEVIVEPIQTFDYRHKPVNRIPLPQRPDWLKETLRNMREFEPLLNVRSLEQPRRYSDWKYDDRKKYENYYDERRRFDDYEPRNESRYSYDDRRNYEERRSYERSRSREHDDFIEDSRYAYKNYRRSEERKKYEDDVTCNKTNRYEEKIQPLRGNKYDERERRVESKVTEEVVHKPAVAPVNMATSGSSKVTLIEDLLSPPGRFSRPARIVIILRGPPGSGKTTLAKLIKDKEVENGGSAPRILSLDDYFMVEHEKEVTEDGRKVKIKEMKYEYEECMEASYRTSLMKSFKKTITDGYFNFIIVDNVNDKVKYFGEMWSFAKQNGFQVYICQLELDVQACTKRNVHGRTEGEIEKCVAAWEPTPLHHPIVDATSLIQAQSIPEVEMEEINSPPSLEEDADEEHAYRSKWDTFDCSLDNLAKLDGTSKPLKPSSTMEDYLQLDEWEPNSESKPGQKRVRWADLEERKQQEKMRAIGFVVGQTNWDRMMDPTMGGSALTQTKYIERVGKY